MFDSFVFFGSFSSNFCLTCALKSASYSLYFYYELTPIVKCPAIYVFYLTIPTKDFYRLIEESSCPCSLFNADWNLRFSEKTLKPQFPINNITPNANKTNPAKSQVNWIGVLPWWMFFLNMFSKKLPIKGETMVAVEYDKA